MLIGLEIKNFAIVSNLSTEWHNGMTAITGETGAGKSIAIDALSLCLGERADAGAVRRPGHARGARRLPRRLGGGRPCGQGQGGHGLPHVLPRRSP